MNDADIQAPVRSFEEGSLPRSEWTHEAHLVVALWYLWNHPRDEATARIREGIRRFNRRQGREAAYHETITLASVAVIGRFSDGGGRAESIARSAQALLAACGDREHLLRYYSDDVLRSDAARNVWVPPDRQSFDDET